MRSWLVPARTPRRATESLIDNVIATGAAGGAWGADPIDQEIGWRPAGQRGREVPYWTQERARMYSVAAYRDNPMARAIVDTYTSFAVGDSGVTYQATNPQVRAIVESFWTDPRVQLGSLQDLFLRDQMLMGETLLELMVGPASGTVRFSPIDPVSIEEITLTAGNPLWPEQVLLAGHDGQDGRAFTVAAVNDATGLREGQAMFWTPWKALMTDTRGMPFLTPILDWLDSYDTVLSNLIDRTALARYLVWDVTVQGSQEDVDKFVQARGGTHVPRSGSIEVHNEAVSWKPQYQTTGAYEDTTAGKAILTQVAGGAGLAKHWLAEPEETNRATGQTMAEPVRRRVGGLQRTWLGYQTELVRFQVDRAVAARRLPRTVDATDPKTGQSYQIPAAQSVLVTGPEIAAADSQITAQVLLNLSTGLEKLRQIGALTPEAARVAARKAWEDYVGVPYTADLDSPEANADDIATAIDDAQTAATKVRPIRPAPAQGGTG
jgi:hypothetical protein